ncbi:unnamed protein product [Phytophthora fragariaefolia]|uniref:Unnamed protein product n=1 Tax=Phytophthora fragariaefolia TaxID=1490495 RepID=A0A9W6XXD3_9STRA|nr:unnamed protein product [Phytophthora fragariaefolia]
MIKNGGDFPFVSHHDEVTISSHNALVAIEMVWLSFAALREEVAQWTDDQARQGDITVKGQLMHQRRISRKCSFFDLASVATGPDGERERLEVILKIIDGELSSEQVDAIRYRIKVGDVVHIHGFAERLEGGASILVHARDITVVRAWKDENPGVTFLPLPTVVATTSKQKENEEGKQDRGVDANDSSVAATERVHCKFWINSKTCQHGDKCEFFHVSDADRKSERAKWLKERLHLKRVRARIDEDPLDPHGKTGKQQRAQVFVEWLIETFSAEFLASGKGVVDVAGGRVQTLFNTDSFLANASNVQLVEQASLLLGMHPDEATDSIFDVAIKFNKPFAVVPCCVFGQKFDRRLANGSKVMSYENLVEYLTAKHPDIEKAFLPFDGKNLVLFRRPQILVQQS